MFINQQAVDYGAINHQMGLPVAIGVSLDSVTIAQDNTYVTALPSATTINRCNYRTQYAFGNVASNQIPVNGEYIKMIQVFATVRAITSQPQTHDLFFQVSLKKSDGSAIIQRRCSTQVLGCLAVSFTALCLKGSYITVEVYGKNGDRFDNGEISVIGWPVQ